MNKRRGNGQRRSYSANYSTARNTGRGRKRVQKKKFTRFIVIIVVIVAAVCALILFATNQNLGGVFHFNSADGKGSTIFEDNEQAVADIDGIPLYEQLIPEGYAGRPGIIREIKYIVIHETSNTDSGADAQSHSSYLMHEAKDTELSWHYTVDDHEIVQNLPDNEVGWHAGDGHTEPGGNINGIGIEICVNSDGNFDTAKDNAAKLAAYLIKKYNLSLGALKQHADFMDKDCPQIIRDNGQWDSFKAKVQDYLQAA